MTWVKEKIAGSDLTGSSGATDRTYTLASTVYVQASLRVVASNYPLVQDAADGYTVSANVITFSTERFDDEVIELQYESGVESVTVAKDTKYTSHLAFVQFLGLAKKIPNRTEQTDNESLFPNPIYIGTGDNSETTFIYSNDNIIKNSETLSYGSTSTSTTNLSRDTHYTVDYDDGVITLTTAGVTALGTNKLYSDHYYINNSGTSGTGLTDTRTQQVLVNAEAWIDRMVNTVFYDGTEATPDFVKVTDELHEGQGKYNRVYQTNKYPVNDTTTTLNGALSASETSVTVTSTNGFPSTGTFAVETDKVTYTGKTSTKFTGCTGVDNDHDDGTSVSSYVFEKALDDEGNSPNWQVMQPDTDYSFDAESGEVKLNNTTVTGTVILDNFNPPTTVWDRVRLSYQYGYDEIYSDITKLTHLVAGDELYTSGVLNALARETNGFSSAGINQVRDEIKMLVNKYKAWIIKDTKP